MYRILSASKGTYVTNKIIGGRRMNNSNVGQAGTLDLFKLYDETYISGTSSPVELSRILIQFDYSTLNSLTASFLNVNDASFSAFLSLKDIYGGQTVPSNYTLALFPLSKSFNEGRGSDVISFRDLDAANWLTASLSPLVTWSQEGAGSSGSLGEDVDIIVSGNISGLGIEALGKTQFFPRGDEDMLLDVTNLVSAALVGNLENHGFRISFSDSDEQDQVTRFVKRFGSNNTIRKTIRPKLIIKFNDAITGSGNQLKFNTDEQLLVFNKVNGINRNFFSGSSELTGTNILSLELVASKSITFTTTSWSPSHSASINHLTRSVVFLSRSYSGSQYTLNSILQPGIYTAPINLSLVTDSELNAFVGEAESMEFKSTWYSADGTLQLAKQWIRFFKPQGVFQNANNQNLIINIVNLQERYLQSETVRLKVFATNINENLIASKIPTKLNSIIVPGMKWQCRNAYTREIIIPYDSSTTLSNDIDGMYFDLYLNDLDVNQVYEIEFIIPNNFGRETYISNEGFRFKVIS